jgi:hypothetical protein
MSNLLGSKPVDDLRLSQATWSKSKNLLRNSSQVLASAEHYLSATGALLQDLEGEGIAEIKSLLLQLVINRRFVKNLTPLGKSKVGESTRHKNLGSS